MKAKLILPIIALCVSVLAIPAERACAASAAAKYLCDYGKQLYEKGNFQDALHEFNKALVIEPENVTARSYINRINGAGQDASGKARQAIPVQTARSEVVSAELSQYERSLRREPVSAEKLFEVTGMVQAGVGVFSDGEFEWKRANFDLNEKNWRILSSSVFNRKENTYDPSIFNRFSVNIDTPQDSKFGFHANITVDPWSFTGKTDRVTLPGAGWDTAELELKYWSNTGYTFSESVYTLQNADVFNTGELKVVDGKVVPASITSTWGNTYSIPALEIHKEFQPLRELWFSYKDGDNLSLTIFPLALEKMAYTSDDPLQLSNKHANWESSPWIKRWKHGNLNSGVSPADFTKGYWDDSISFACRDSDGVRLTALRGFSLALSPGNGTSLDLSVATPKDLWQEYSDVDNIASAVRIKQEISEKAQVGFMHTMRAGFIEEDRSLDSRNNVFALDGRYEFTEGSLVNAEIAASVSQYDLSSDRYRTRKRGNAYYFSFIDRYPNAPIIGKDYYSIKKGESESFMSKLRFFGAHMDEGFDPAVSSYRQTRRDAFWSRHIHFNRPLEYFYQSLYYPTLNLENLEPFAIGDGIDIGRDVVGLRWQIYWEDTLQNLFDIRNVHSASGKYIETVSRDELSWKVNERVTAKALGLYQDMPKTKGGIDPFLYDSLTGEYLTDWSSTPVADGKDPSLKTASLGMEYVFTDWLSVNGVYEYTNDYTLAYDNFPRGDLNSAQPSMLTAEYGNIFRSNRVFLYDQQYFPQPPYEFYNVYKAGLKLIPAQSIELYLDYTRNEFEQAGQISDAMNHIGAELAFVPDKKVGFYLRYTYSRWDDLDRIVSGSDKTIGHHNVYGEIRYFPSNDSELTLQYGVSPNYPVIDSATNDPYGGSLLTIDTQHIIRMFYRKKF